MTVESRRWTAIGISIGFGAQSLKIGQAFAASSVQRSTRPGLSLQAVCFTEDAASALDDRAIHQLAVDLAGERVLRRGEHTLRPCHFFRGRREHSRDDVDLLRMDAELRTESLVPLPGGFLCEQPGIAKRGGDSRDGRRQLRRTRSDDELCGGEDRTVTPARAGIALVMFTYLPSLTLFTLDLARALK